MPFSARTGFFFQPAGAPPAPSGTPWYDITGSEWTGNVSSSITGGTVSHTTDTVTYFNAALASRSAVLHPNGNIYCAPRSTGQGMLEYDPVNGAVALLQYGALASVTTGSNTTAQRFFHSACLTESGNILCIPFKYDNFIQVDPEAGTATEFDGGVNLSSDFKFSGGVLGQNGNIYCIPQNFNGVAEVDPVNEAVTIKTYGLTMSGTTKWWGGYRSPKDDKIYCAPLQNGAVLVISADGTTATRETFGLTFNTTPNQHYGATGDMYGNVVLVRGDGPNTKVINPDTGTGFTVSTNISYGGVTGADGNVYTISKSSNVQKIDLSGANTTPTVTTAISDSGNKMAATTALNNKTYIFRDGGSSTVYVLDTSGNAANLTNGANLILSPYFKTSKI